ncbi:MAG: hypothetical protein AB8B81_08030 [Halioglobus sp.]
MNIPNAYSELLTATGPTILSVVALDGSVQSSLVWSELEGGVISINMLNSAPKLKSLVRNGKATVLKIDPESEDNYISIRCSLLDVVSEGAIAHLDKLTLRHYGKQQWYGEVVPNNEDEKKARVIVYLKPEKVYCT